MPRRGRLPATVAVGLVVASWLASRPRLAVVSAQTFNMDATFGSQCLYVFDNADCAGAPLTAGCTDLDEADSCFSLKPLNACVLLDAEGGIYQNQTCVRWDSIATTPDPADSTTTTSTTTAAPSTAPPPCEDTTWEEDMGYLLWTDAWNFTCADFEANNWCSALANYSYSPNERGATAAQSCCACGGGTTGGNPFIHPDTVTQLPEYLEECSNFEYGLWQPCPFTPEDDDPAERQQCLFTCRNIVQPWCGEPEANISGSMAGNFSARQACCMCGGGDQPPEPYIEYDVTTCTFFSANITPDGLSNVLYDEEGLQYQISYARSNPPACWTGLAFVIVGAIGLIAGVGFSIQQCVDRRRHTQISVENRNRLPRQSAMELSVLARKRELFEAEQKAEEDEEVERQRHVRNAEADAWLTQAKEDTAVSMQDKWQRDQARRNQAARDQRAEAKMREARAARIAAFEAEHGADWEQRLVEAQEAAV